MNDQSNTFQSITRTGRSNTAVRYLVGRNGTGRNAEIKTFGPIVKVVTAPIQFREGMPIEQYAFEYKGQIGERFADVTAMVMKETDLRPALNTKPQEYMQRALRILKGREELRLVNTQPLDYATGPLSYTKDPVEKAINAGVVVQ